MATKSTKTWQEFTPQQKEFLKYYLDPKSETWSNMVQSALKAGYTQDYADNLASLKWFKEGVEDNKLLQKAVDNLWDFVGNESSYKWDATKFVLSTLGKNKYSTRTEITGKDGEKLLPDEASLKKSKDAIKEILK